METFLNIVKFCKEDYPHYLWKKAIDFHLMKVSHFPQLYGFKFYELN